MIGWINRIFNLLGALLIRPFQDYSPWVGLSVAALVFAVLALLVFKYTSNQERLRRARGRMVARSLDVLLFTHPGGAIFGILGGVVAAGGRYLGATLAPLLIMLAPMALLLVQLAGWYAYRPFRPGEGGLLTAQFDAPADLAALQPTAAGSAGIRLDPAPFISQHDRQAVWRFTAVADDPDGWIEVRAGGAMARKTVAVAPGRMAVSPRRVRVDQTLAGLACPAEPPLARSFPARALTLNYPARTLTVGGRTVNWVVALFGLSLALGLVLKYPLKVEL